MATPNYFIGLDLGQARDYTAICVLEEPLWIPSEALDSSAGEAGWAWRANIKTEPGWVSPAELLPGQFAAVKYWNYNYGRPSRVPLHIRHLERPALGTPYPEVVDRVANIVLREPVTRGGSALLVDAGGPGRPMANDLSKAGMRPIRISFHGGVNVSLVDGGAGYNVPVRDLVGAAQVALQNGLLKMSPELDLAETLTKELLAFRRKINPNTAHDSYGQWREGKHDDLVFAVSMAVWYRQHRNMLLDRANAQRGRCRSCVNFKAA
jgi:hypothetical protein